MTEPTDGQLLDEFVKHARPAAFEQVVRRHMDWVYSCARRMLRDQHLAEDVAQAVFILLAGKARALSGHAELAGWLFRATRYCAANALKQQARRRRHEQEAGIMHTAAAHDDPANWEQVYPVLDQAVTGLGRADRHAVLLRFYQGKTMGEVGTAMGISEEAAKKRVQRAVKKLRGTMLKSGVTVSAGGLATVMAAQMTQAAPAGLVEAALAATAGGAKATSAGMIAKAAESLFWWAKAKVAAMVLIGGVAGGVTCGVVVLALGRQDREAPAASAPALSTVPSMVFDALYEKAPASGSELSMKVGKNTFAVTAVVRSGADGQTLATDGRGKPIDRSSLPLVKIQPPAGASKDIVVIFLQPERDRYDIDRLRVFDHMTRRRVANVVVTQVPDLSALRIAARPGTLPQKIDLWLDVASYDAANVAVSLPAKKDATVAIGGARVGFDDIRDGAWSFAAGRFTTVNHDIPQTTLRLKSTGKWTAGRYQISAVSKSGQKYLSSFFIDLSREERPILFCPFALEQTDHFELRPLAHEPPFFFDGIELPAVGPFPPAQDRISQPLIVNAGKQSRVQLPCGAVVELAGIANHPPAEKGWWGVDALPVPPVDFEIGGMVSDDNGRLTVREIAARLIKAPEGISGLLWQFEPAANWVSSGSERESGVIAAFQGGSPVTVRVGVAATPWETVEEIAAEKLPAEVQCWPGVIEAPQSTADGVSLYTSTVNLPGNLRMVLIDHAGKPHTHNSSSSSAANEKLAPWGYQSITMTYRGLRREDVRSLRFETRREEYAAFENVPLKPK